MDVIVFGSLIMDMVVYCQRHPSPGETLIGDRLAYFPGGKGANQAVAAAKAGAPARLLGAVGQDAFGATLVDFCASHGVNVEGVSAVPGTSSGAATVTVSATGENAIVVVPGANAAAQANGAIARPVIALAQFEVPLAETMDLFAAVRRVQGITILNPSPFQMPPARLLRDSSYLIVNETEYARLVQGVPATDAGSVIAQLAQLPPAVTHIIVTLGPAGFVMRVDGDIYQAPGHAVTAVDTTGAGDCFAGTFAAALAHGQAPYAAALQANAAAALSVTCAGAGPSMPDSASVTAFLQRA